MRACKSSLEILELFKSSHKVKASVSAGSDGRKHSGFVVSGSGDEAVDCRVLFLADLALASALESLQFCTCGCFRFSWSSLWCFREKPPSSPPSALVQTAILQKKGFIFSWMLP
jgi:hypothetical protein